MRLPTNFLSLFILFTALILSGCTEVTLASHVAKQINPPTKSQGTFKIGNPYKINGKTYRPQESYNLTETGIASWYGPQFHGKQTANGEIFDMNELTAAHRTLQMPSLVRVTNLENGRSLIVRVNDRGPYKRGRVMDLSKRAAELLGYKEKGTAKIRLQVLKKESLQIAQAAKSGQSTKGYEVAMNQQGRLTTPAPQPAAVTRAPTKTMIPGHTRAGQFYPDPVITEMPVTPTGLFVQAGSFTVHDNAVALRNSLQAFAPASLYPVTIKGTQFYRVRLPVGSIAEADEILARLVTGGHNSAIIVVE